MQSSVQYRNQGNRKFRSSQKKSNNFSLDEQFRLLLQAEQLYKQAEAVARIEDEVGSALKNLGICELKMSEYEQGDVEISKRLRAAQNVLMQAYRSGLQSFKDQEWLINTLHYLVQVGQAMGKLGKTQQDVLLFEGIHWKKVFSDLNFDSYNVISFVLENIINYVTSGMEISQKLLENQQEILSKTILLEFEWLLNEAHELARQDTYLKGDIELLIRKRVDLLYIIDSHVARKEGQEIFDQIINQRENFQSIEYQGRRAEDYFQEARSLGKGRCQLAEGSALSCLGVLQYKVFKNQQQALKALQMCVNLNYSGNQMSIVQRSTWYINAKSILKEIQMQQQRINAEEMEKRRAGFQERFHMQIQQLHNIAEQGCIHFVQYIYQHYPPLNAPQISQLDNNQNQRKILLYAVKQYHPDKQHGRQEEERFVFEEISKILNSQISKLR